MHRFRKRSDGSTKPTTKPLQSQAEWQPLPELPPASNFRTSLILPDLTRRFTLLRTSSGQPLSIEQLRARFAEQRARGAENSISVEEEDMLLETLGRIREGREDLEEGADGAGEDVADGEDNPVSREELVGEDHGSYGGSSVRSSNITTSFVPSPSVGSSPSSRSAKRYSNNLFGSGRDYNYIRNQTTRTGSQHSVPSMALTESSLNVEGNSTYSDRPGTPEGDGSTSSCVQSSPITDSNDKTPTARSIPLSASGPPGQTAFAVEYRLSKTLNPAALKRASLALEEALKDIEEDIEEEAEDQIVMPRSAPATKTQYMEGGRFSSNSNESDSSSQRPSKFRAGTALSPEKYSPDAEEQRASPVGSFRSRMSPSPRLPGYIPGMPRPMTPRDQSFDGAEQARAHSTTPRPTSPILPNINGSSSPLLPAGIAAGLMRRETNGYTSSPRAHNGPFSVDAQRSYDSSTDESVNSNSSVYTRRRPASPLATPSYQPMAVPPRPTTPSNITWNTSSNSISSGAPKSHSRNASESSIDFAPSPERSVFVTGRSLRSPAPTNSSLIDDPSFGGGPWDKEASSSRNRPPAAVPSIDLGSPVVVSNRSMHSPTPTQSRSPAPAALSLMSGGDVFSGSTSKRGSRQQGGQSPFDFGRTYPLVFSPTKSSRSSIASEGSSYHSDDGMNRLDCDFDFFGETTAKPSWHDVSGSDVTAAGYHDDVQDDSEPDDIIYRYAGLTKADFVAIQEKLVTAAVNKAASPDPRERAPSLRRRRPSTSQSNYSLNGRESRVASPPPQVKTNSREMLSTPQKIEKPVPSSVSPDSIGSLQPSPNSAANSHRPAQSMTSSTRQQVDLSPTTRRNRDLAEAIFGDQSSDYSPPEESLSPPEKMPEKTPEKMPGNAAHYFTPSTPPLLVRSPSQLRSPAEEPASATSSSQHYPTQMSRNPSILRSPRNLADTDLALEVQRKTEAATASLKRGPSVKYHDNASSVSVARKRIAPHQISSPHLVSSSTSLDTIPLRSASVASNNAPKPGKLGSRLRRWGTLRGKPTIPNGDEVTPFLLDVQTSPTSPLHGAPSPSPQTAQYASSSISTPQVPASAGLAEPVRPQVPIPSPPATAGPGIKSFMSRFRKTSKTSDISLDNGPTSVEYGGRTSTEQGRPRQPLPEFTFPQPQPAASANAAPHTPSNVVITPPQNDSSTEFFNRPVSHNQSQSSTNHSLALKQLFDAASTIGLDQTALNDLLQRSGSTSSNATMLTRNNSSFTNSTLPSPNEEALSRSRSSYDGKSQANFVASDRGDDTMTMPINGAARKRGKADDSDSAGNAVVRRTLIFPSEARTSTIDLNILMRKNSSARRRRSASAGSVNSSSRSVHDRAPTPPPPRSPTGRRFSHDASPPVPQLPASLSAQAESLLMPLARPRPAPAGGIEKSNSAYESLYDMYASDRAGSGGFSDSETRDAASPEPTRAVEVIELANGETIWSIVNGLRDDDAESLYAGRSSFASEYSGPRTAGDGGQVAFKEHARTGSKGSTSSFLSRKKSPTEKNRPETKIFYSSSNQIGRLIENLSEGQESGSFNFVPTKRPGHSAKSSMQSDGDMHWTVEERLEHMLGSMSTS